MAFSQSVSSLGTIIPHDPIAQAIEQSQSQHQRKRSLPTDVVVALLIGMSFWATDSIVDVFKNLMAGLNGTWIRQLVRLKTPTSSSISEARQRVGPAVMTRLFELVARPMATVKTKEAFLGGLRLMAIDGTVFDVPDTETNSRVFGYPGTRKGTKAAFPKARLVLLVELGTHLITDALISPYRIGERVRARKLLRGVGPGMLVMWDRGLHSFRMVLEALKQKCHILGRVPANVKFEVVKILPDGSYLSWIAPDRKSKKKGATRKPVRVIEYVIEENGVEQVYRLITDLVDVDLFPALLLAQEYHWRWEAENTLDEMKTHLNGRKTLIRSNNPREVIQEIYGWLLAHYCIRCLMFKAAEKAEISPLRLGFTGTLRIMRRAVPLFQQAVPEEINLFMSWLIAEILDNQIPAREGRINPRVVKKSRSKFNAAKPYHRKQGTKLQQLTFKTVKVA
ncbi:MAG: IS4 family transposase [Moorea sp. SIO3I7]|nr:IS4 family transposase [Moorena sp. SIO3I7]NEO07292.1 IS4 family transposase [Moorena sp. SIO3I8]NEO19752.1 IS4 family transposase [Moorena sp. SIO4A5]NEP25332.1 IS4 family transposase [Moorena sp. SIO3I6]NEQ58783.1 IS4 family transposase [Moorena sp. SIO4A1]